MTQKKIILLAIFVLLLGGLLTAFGLGYWHKHSRLAQLRAVYEGGLHPDSSRFDIFCPEAELAYRDSLLALGQDSIKNIGAKADALMKLGEEQKAIALLTAVYPNLAASSRIAGSPGQPHAGHASSGIAAADPDPRKLLALAYLRLGERNNCLAHHNHSSCIFPIKGEGIYTDPYLTQKSIQLYQSILRADPSDLESRWLLNLAYMTLGQYPAGVPGNLLIPGLDRDSSSIKLTAFEDMAVPLRLADQRSMAGGAIIDDFNNDGYLDIILSSWGWGPEDGMHYFRNNGNGTFTDIAKAAGIAGIKGSLNIMQVDYNNDGLTDIFMLRGGWRGAYGKQPKTLLKNNGDGTFTDVTAESGIVSLHPTQTAVWADFNNDGWPDVFIGHESTSIYDSYPCELWINDQDGTFSEVAQAAGCGLAGFVKGVTSADYNRDGWPDIYLSQRDGKKVLLKNKGLKTRIPEFENVTHSAGLDKDITYTFPAWFWDYDNDGWPDIFTCGYRFNGSLANSEAASALHLPQPTSSNMYLYHNNHDGTFTNASSAVGLDRPIFAMGSNFGDIDNDGWLDLYLGTGNPDLRSLSPNHLFKNIDGHSFADVTRSARVGNLQKGHGVAIADLDNDGDQDIFAETGGAYKGDAYYNSCYINPGQNDNNWISITLEGSCFSGLSGALLFADGTRGHRSCRSALGAHLILHITDNGLHRTIYRDITSGGSFGASPLRQEIGIGRATRIDTLEVRWPASGLVQYFANVVPRQFIRIKEGEGQVHPLPLKKLSFKYTIDCPAPATRLTAVKPPAK
ncbi:MAG TPA: FG-GAP-like repeat-containing protein [Puia sp.]|nr:FG-GAP-like repeat-containing protein [Puia sp.]